MLDVGWSSHWAFVGNVNLCAVMALQPEVSEVIILKLTNSTQSAPTSVTVSWFVDKLIIFFILNKTVN